MRAMQTGNDEILREALLDLAKARAHEERQRRKTEALLAGLRVLIKPMESSRMFRELLAVMREIINFEEAFVLMRRVEGSLMSTVSTSDAFLAGRWTPRAMFNRVLEGHPATVFNVGLIEEWQQQPAEILGLVKSALHVPLRGGQQAAILVCTHSRPSFFSRNHQRLAENFSTLAAQALLNAERQQMETQLFQARKMEALGILAGGIAHDFNNILTPIIIHSQMALLEPDSPPAIRQNLRQIEQAAERATGLIRQILDFNSQGRHEPRPIRLGPVIKEALQLLRSTIAPSIEMAYRQQAENDLVAADPTQMLQVIMNLALNAAHAMRETGGRLDLSLAAADPPLTLSLLEAGEKSWLKLVISDTGPGIPPENIDRIFDPFFTTKNKGEGSGMGLAVVHGIITKHRGTITVYSEPERGTSFEIRLPEIPDHDREAGIAAKLATLPGGRERILFVDDELPVVDAFAPMLGRLGYRVDTSTSSVAALEIIRANPAGCDLLITDYNMPGLDGGELAREVKRIKPLMPVIICTGFIGPADEAACRDMGVAAYITKPFNMNDLAVVIRRTLDENLSPQDK